MSISQHFFIAALFTIVSCSPGTHGEKMENSNVPAVDKNEFITLNGNTQGTTYTVKYDGDSSQIYKEEIETILKDFDDMLSLWVPTSELCKLNNDSSATYELIDPHGYFIDVFKLSRTLYNNTNGYFDPSIDLIIEALGLGLDKKSTINFEEIEKLKKQCSFEKSQINFTQNTNDETSFVINKNWNTRLNFNAIAQGYSVDVISKFLNDRGHENFYVEIGGELKVSGLSPSNQNWRIGIDRPKEGERHVDYIMKLKNTSVATSGSYRKYIIKDGKKYSHTINPITGLPVNHNLLSVTVMMDSCAMADGYSTAFMAMGKDDTIDFISNNPSLKIEIFLIFQGENELETYASSGFMVERLM